MSDTPKPVPLNGREVQEAILYKVAESLDKSCHLAESNAYTAFRAEVSVKLVLSDFGREQKDNHILAAAAGTVEPDADVQDVTLQIPEMAPNQLRIETDQPIPVIAIEDGKQVMKRVKYQARRGRPPKA